MTPPKKPTPPSQSSTGAPPPGPAPSGTPPARVRVDEVARRLRTDPLPLVYVLGFLILGGTLAYLYTHPATPRETQQAVLRVDTLQGQVQTLADRLAKLEARPAGAAPDLAPLDRRIAALEGRPAPSGPTAAPAVNLAPLEARIAAVEGRAPVNLQPLEARVAALEGKPPPAPFDPAPLTGRLDVLAGKQAADAAAVNGRLNGVDARVAAVADQAKQTAGQIGTVAERSGRVVRLQAAMAALEAGQPLGDIPGAPPAVARFAAAPPKTEQELRRSFDAAAEAARQAGQPALMENRTFGDRLWARAQQAVTVRQSDRVLIGDPLAGKTTVARAALDAGDLAGAVKALDGLAGPAKEAMAEWTGQARALLDARAALASMAARS